MGEIGKILEGLQAFLSRKYFFAFSLASGILLFASDNFLGQLGLTGFMDDYRQVVAIVFIISISMFVASIFVDILDLLGSAGFGRWDLRNQRKYLEELDPRERLVLREYIYLDRRNMDLRLSDPAVTGLEHQGIIYKPSQRKMVDSRNPIMTYRIQHWAWDYLKKHPDLVGLDEDKQQGKSV